MNFTKQRIKAILILPALPAILLFFGWFYHSQEQQSSFFPNGRKLSKIIVADDSSYAPFVFADAESNPRGISIDLWKLWSKKTGVAVEFRLMEWEAALTAVREGNADVVGGLFRTSRREEFFDFTKPYFSIATSIFFHRHIHGIRSFQDLDGFRIGVVRGDSAEELIQKQYPNAGLKRYPGAESMVKAALSGEIRVFIADTHAGHFYLAKLGAGNEFREAAEPVSVNDQHAAVRKGNHQLLALLQQGLDRISDREKLAIIDAWTGNPLFFGKPWGAILTILAFIAAVICLMLLWNLHLERRVSKATGELLQRNEELRRSEQNYREIFNAASDMIFLHNAEDGSILDMNETAMELCGYSKEELLGKSVSDISPDVPSFSGEEALSKIRKAVSDGKLAVEWLFQRRSGETFWAEVALKSSSIGGENRVLAVIRDISKRKRAENAVKESEERFRNMMEQSPFSMIVFSPQGDILHANEANIRLWNITKENLKTYNIMNDQQLQSLGLMPIIQRAFAGERIITPAVEYDLSITLGTGNRKIVQGDFYPIRDKNGEISCIILIHQDITERRQAEMEKEKLQAQLVQAQKMEAVGRLAGGVAHDFNNMLSVILGNAELAKMRCNPSERIHAYLTVIEKTALRSAELTRQLLAFARKQTIAPKVLNLNDAVSAMLRMLRRLIGEDIDLAWRPKEKLWSVKLDPSQLDQLLVNLCVNARDAIAGVGKITIETENFTFDESYCATHANSIPGEYVMLAVSDDGCGMDKEILRHLFEPFFTTKEMGKGTGLGLATVFGIVKQNEGFINVYSEPDNGTTFKIYLPRFVGEAVETTAAQITETPKSCGETVLLVEDEPAMIQISQSMLEALEYRVLTAKTPGEAIRAAEAYSEKIHLLITDVVMPEMNGRDLATKIAEIESDNKCLFISGYTANVIAHRGVLDDGVNFLQKPFSLQSLAVKLREVLDEPSKTD